MKADIACSLSKPAMTSREPGTVESRCAKASVDCLRTFARLESLSALAMVETASSRLGSARATRRSN